jgi:hypothetical protein
VKDTKISIGTFFSFDYMGSSEFEWGAIPKAKKSLLDLLNAEGSEGLAEPVKIKVGENVAWYVGPKTQLELAKVFFASELENDYTGMKERSEIRDSYQNPSFNGWWCIDGGSREGAPLFGLFMKKDHARDFLRGLRG